MPLIGLSEAQRVLGLRSRGTLYRKIESGELPSIVGRDGKRLVESDGLRERWESVVREKVGGSVPSPRPRPAVVHEAEASSPAPAAHVRAEHRPARPGRPRRSASVPAVETPDGERVDYNLERALHEREKRMLAELERMQKEGELVYREDIEAAQNAVNLQILNRAEALPKQIKLDIPHLTAEEMLLIEKRIFEVFEAVANYEFEELEE